MAPQGCGGIRRITEMKEFTYTIKEPVGIHARPAGMLAKEAKSCQSTVTIVDKNG